MRAAIRWCFRRSSAERRATTETSRRGSSPPIPEVYRSRFGVGGAHPPLEGEGQRERSERRGGVNFAAVKTHPTPLADARDPPPPGEGGPSKQLTLRQTVFRDFFLRPLVDLVGDWIAHFFGDVA